MSEIPTALEPMDCARVTREDIVEQYVVGRLTEADRDAFERHYFECARCFDELRQYQLIQEELQQTSASEERVPIGGPLRSGLAAAAVVLLGLALWWMWPSTAPPPAPASASLPTPAPVDTLAHLAVVTPPPYEPVTLRSTPDAATRRFRDAMTRYREGDYAGAVPGLVEAVQLDPDRAQAHFYLGACYLLTQQPARAIPVLEAALARGDSAYAEEARFYLAKAFLATGNAAASRTALEAVVAIQGPRAAEARTLVDKMNALPVPPPSDGRRSTP
jgi:tetratricopeptide (TPR) repeat protein